MSETHRDRHRRLHDALDELLTDYFEHHPQAHIRDLDIQHLIAWARAQCDTPTDGGATHHNGTTFHPEHKHK